MVLCEENFLKYVIKCNLNNELIAISRQCYVCETEFQDRIEYVFLRTCDPSKPDALNARHVH